MFGILGYYRYIRVHSSTNNVQLTKRFKQYTLKSLDCITETNSVHNFGNSLRSTLVPERDNRAYSHSYNRILHTYEMDIFCSVLANPGKYQISVLFVF